MDIYGGRGVGVRGSGGARGGEVKALSLYAGIGGEALAAHAAGFEHVAFCESDPYCRKVLAEHGRTPIAP